MKRKRGQSDDLEPSWFNDSSKKQLAESSINAELSSPIWSASMSMRHEKKEPCFASAASPPLTPVNRSQKMDWERVREDPNPDHKKAAAGKHSPGK